ncbi:DUF1146 family protein [Paenibacillus contaminans]|jgi:uncharacterized integral membrane protein (TIGR02327 family)|uniref:DUF1146 domain-containing protein n=1 Tax=Paenibacillus contaminans TaxID=450362 RepID=A0A329MDJ2_9BACL|nr:DUF1146 family protein [Paenibacillus contaminans]RAV17366.1 DUF1146 domain-containing protein [Paenibacillus contaminans]
MDGSDPLNYSFAMSSLGYIILTLCAIGLSWWALQQVRLDLFVKNPKSAQVKVLQIFLSIALGYEVSRFLIDYFNWSALLKGLF